MENDVIELLPSLIRNIDILKGRLGAPQNMDVIVRRFRAGAFEAALLAVDGMADTKTINENILKPCMDLPESAGEETPDAQRVSFLMTHAVSVLPMKLKKNFDELISDALSGQSVLLCEGCAVACVMDTRGFEKRTIGRPEAEKVVLGAHESFSESIRTSITLLRRIVQREELTTEFISVGGKMKTRCALLYLRGTADERMIERVRKRLLACGSDFPLSLGDVEQVIESHPFALIPQCVRTERPDRAASFLAEGQVIILADGSPEVLGAPATIFHQLHTPDDASMRWQYGTFLRIVRLLGILIHLYLPGIYLSVLRFHPELLSAMLLTSVYETSSRVPFPVYLEALLMTLAFALITEAGLRAPGALGSALGIVSGLILGQSAVSADIVSPLLLIVVAASGLGGFCIPGYALSVGMKIVQFALMSAGAAGGLFAMALATAALLCLLMGMTSVGSPLTAPVAPHRAKNPDVLLRLPLRFQKAAAFYAMNKRQTLSRSARVKESFRVRACAAGLCVGVMVFITGAGAAMTLSLNAAWLSALSALPACALAAALCRRRLVRELGGERPSAVQRLLTALSLAACCVVCLSALLSLSEQTFLSLARSGFVLAAAFLFMLLCAAGGENGAARAAFALRYAAAFMLAALLLCAAADGQADGVFPLLGAGGKALGLSCLAMFSCAAPVLLLTLPPKEAEPLSAQDVPAAGFFAWRAAAGAAAGAGLLFAVTLGTTHETLAGLTSWGKRLRLFGAGMDRAGLFFALLTAGQSVMLILSAALLFLCSARALSQAFASGAKAWRAPLAMAAAVAAALAASAAFGYDGVLAAGAFLWVPASAALLWRGRIR